MARRRKTTGFWLTEILASLFRRVIRWFKKSRSPEELLESVQEKVLNMRNDAYWKGVNVEAKRKRLEAEVSRQKIHLDRLIALRAKAVGKGTAEGDLEARGYDQEIQILAVLVRGLEAQLQKTLTTPQVKAVVRLNIAKSRIYAARTQGYVAQINTNELLAEIAEMQEELAGLDVSPDLWEMDELRQRAEEGRFEVEARLELSADLAQAQVGEEEVGFTLGEMSPELVVLMQQRDAGELKVEEDGAGLDESLLDFATREE